MTPHFASHAAAALLLGCLLPAQSTVFGGQLVGTAGPDGPIASIAGRVYTQEIATCAASVFRGSALLFPAPNTSAGGSAYDAARQGVWVSDGTDIALKDIGTNSVTCQFKAQLTTGAKGNYVTGLAHSDRRRELIQLEEFPTGPSNNSLTLRFYDTSQCPPVLLRKMCTIPIPRGNTAGTARGLTYDEARDLIYFTWSVPGLNGYSSGLHVIDYSLLCVAPPTEVPVPPFANCGGVSLNPVTGLAYDSCEQVLYVTEGTVTMLLGMKNPLQPVNLSANKQCCKFGVTRMVWASLAFVPESRVAQVGQSCLAPGCGSCTTLRFGLEGDLALGNKNLKLRVDGAPPNGAAALFVSIGQCGAGLQLPGLCGLVHPQVGAGQPILLGSFPLAGGGACAAGLQLPVAVPFDRAACGVDLCAQFLLTCPNSSGNGLTNAVQFRVGR